MNRRDFISKSSALSLPLLLKGMPIYATGSVAHPLLEGIQMNSCGRILVIIQLNGGNDGLNTVIPLDRYSQLAQARPNVLIPAASVLPLNGLVNTGLHPSMTGLKNLFNDGKVNLVQGVTHPSPNFSHFQSQDIWFSGATNILAKSTGWLGRQLDTAYPNYPSAYPNNTMPDPLSIQIGGVLPLSLQGPAVTMAYNAPNPNALINVATGKTGEAPANEYGNELRFLRLMKDQSNAYTSAISTAYNTQGTLSNQYPSQYESLAEQLKIVARLIGGGLTTPVYVVNHAYSFDSHVDQVSKTNPAEGYHANILGQLSVAISAFQNDISLMGKANKVAGMTFSEFGRRVINNASYGTDHGSGAPVIFFGAGVKPGLTGTSPLLPDVSDANTQVPMQYDFRQLYASVIQQWFCMDSGQSDAILNGNFSAPEIFVNTNQIPLPIQSIQLIANWMQDNVKITFEVIENNWFDRFEIEKSDNGKNFQNIETIRNYSENTQNLYTFLDQNGGYKLLYYRIKGYSKQNEILFSKIVALKAQDNDRVSIFPNPITNFKLNIAFFTDIYEPIEINIVGTMGETLYYNQFNPNGSLLITIDLPPIFNSNKLYIIHLTDEVINFQEKILFE